LRHLYQNNKKKPKKNNYFNNKLLATFNKTELPLKIVKLLLLPVIINIMRLHEYFFYPK